MSHSHTLGSSMLRLELRMTGGWGRGAGGRVSGGWWVHTPRAPVGMGSSLAQHHSSTAGAPPPLQQAKPPTREQFAVVVPRVDALLNGGLGGGIQVPAGGGQGREEGRRARRSAAAAAAPGRQQRGGTHAPALHPTRAHTQWRLHGWCSPLPRRRYVYPSTHTPPTCMLQHSRCPLTGSTSPCTAGQTRGRRLPGAAPPPPAATSRP